MPTLTAVHFIYIIMTVIILAALLCKKEIVLPCIIGVFLIALVYSGSLISAIQALNNAIIASNSELYSILLVIAVITAMSKAMHKLGIDDMMISPFRKVIKNSTTAFWGIGICMLIAAWLLWPSPAVALIGALLLPVAGAVGLPAIYAAVAMNLFGHGMGLSSDYFIQGAPAISSAAAGVGVTDVMKSSIPLWAVMAVSTSVIAFLMMRKDMKNKSAADYSSVNKEYEKVEIKNPTMSKILTAVFVLAFVAMIACMLIFNIVGGDATALVTGTCLILTVLFTICGSGLGKGLEDLVDYVKEGFIFAVKIFAPVIVIASFFFLGSQGFAETVLGEGAPAILNDISLVISAHVPMNKAFVAIIEVVIGVITGLDGSGFSGLPLVGSIAATFGATISNLNVSTLTALGQITTVWVGGGTVIPWAVIPVAAICGVEPAELARKNLIPVACGILITTVVAIFLL